MFVIECIYVGASADQHLHSINSITTHASSSSSSPSPSQTSGLAPVGVWRLTWCLGLLALLTCLTGEGCDLHRLISLMFRPSACQLSAVVSFRLLVLRSGTAYQMMSPPLRLCQPSGAIWRHIYSAAVTTLSHTAHTFSDYSAPRGGVAA